jgi:hypothetical protein
MSALSTAEEIRLSQLEDRIETSLQAVQQSMRTLWQSLAEIRDRRLYRTTHDTFENYCQHRWDKGRRYINRLIAAAEVIANLEAVGTTVPIPLQERALRPLAELDTATDQCEALEAAAAIAPEDTPTGLQITRAVKAVKAKASNPSPTLQPGQQLTVLDESSPHYGQRVEVLRSEGLIVEVATDKGQTAVFLTNEVAEAVPLDSKQALKATLEDAWAAQKSKADRLEALESALQVQQLRITLLETKLNEAIELLQRHALSPAEQNWLAVALSLIA